MNKIDITAGSSFGLDGGDLAAWHEAVREAQLHLQAITDDRCANGREAIAKRIADAVEQAIEDHAAAYRLLAPRYRASKVHVWCQNSMRIDRVPSLRVIRQYLKGRST